LSSIATFSPLLNRINSPLQAVVLIIIEQDIQKVYTFKVTVASFKMTSEDNDLASATFVEWNGSIYHEDYAIYADPNCGVRPAMYLYLN